MVKHRGTRKRFLTATLKFLIAIRGMPLFWQRGASSLVSSGGSGVFSQNTTQHWPLPAALTTSLNPTNMSDLQTVKKSGDSCTKRHNLEISYILDLLSTTANLAFSCSFFLHSALSSLGMAQMVVLGTETLFALTGERCLKQKFGQKLYLVLQFVSLIITLSATL